MVLNMTDRGLTPVTKSIPLAVADPTVYSSLVHQAGLHVVGNRGYTRVIASPPPNAEEVLGLIADLDAWKNGLPSYFVDNTAPPDTYPWLDFAVQKLFWRFCNLRIIFLRRPFLERALKRQPLNPSLSDEKVEGFLSPLEVAERQCVRLCMQSARDTIRSIHEFFSTHVASPLEWWYGL
jgi:transcriptional regulatory protein GAL4